jgi:hypothetical protein
MSLANSESGIFLNREATGDLRTDPTLEVYMSLKKKRVLVSAVFLSILQRTSVWHQLGPVYLRLLPRRLNMAGIWWKKSQNARSVTS